MTITFLTGGMDFTLESNIVAIPKGSTNVSVNISIVDDDDDDNCEDSETFNITIHSISLPISSPCGVIIDPNKDVATVTIVDNCKLLQSVSC